MRRLWIVPLVVGAWCLFAAACGGNDASTKQYYGADGYRGLSNSNPNLPVNPSFHTYNDDVRMIYRALSEVRGISGANVVLNGPNAHIAIRVAESATADEKDRVRTQAYKAVSNMMPRYHVTVTVR